MARVASALAEPLLPLLVGAVGCSVNFQAVSAVAPFAVGKPCAWLRTDAARG
jgi:hypothetical protein